MKMNAGAWIGIIGGLIGLVIGMGAVITTMGPSGIYIAAGILLFFGGMFFLFYKLLIGPALLSKRLQKEGLDGKALIKEVRDTGVTVNNSPQVKLIVDVKNYLGQTYSTTIRVLVSRINPFVYQPGMTIPVKIDPKNEKNVVINTSGEVSTNSKIQRTAAGDFDEAGKAKLMVELEQLQKDNDAILFGITSLSARAIVKNYKWLGININGNNPLVELLLEVLPDAGPPFMATVKGAIAEQSVSKYQVGEEIFVKYDPNDLRKVTIEHS